MNPKLRDPRYSTPRSLAAADAWRAARTECGDLAARIHAHGLMAVTLGEFKDATARMINTTADLAAAIPARLARFDPADWPDRGSDVSTAPGSLRRRHAWQEARTAWAVAHDVWTGDLEPLVAERLAQLDLADAEEVNGRASAGRANG